MLTAKLLPGHVPEQVEFILSILILESYYFNGSRDGFCFGIRLLNKELMNAEVDMFCWCLLDKLHIDQNPELFVLEICDFHLST